MKRNILTIVALSVSVNINAQELIDDLTLYTYSNQDNIEALKSVTLKNGFTIPAGRTVKISINTMPISVSRPSVGQNYILTKTFRTKGVTLNTLNSSRTIGDENQTIQYFDGLSRPIQNIHVMASPNYKDVVQHIEYDAFGRESKKYLPYASANRSDGKDKDGSFKPTAGEDVLSFYKVNGGWDSAVVKTGNPYAITVFENSPLNRVQQQGAPGASWQPVADRTAVIETSGSGHTVVSEYGTNVGDDVKLWSINSTETGATSAFYAAGKLYKIVIKDENWVNTAGKKATVEEYKDFEDRVVLRRTWETNTKKLETYYVYDDFGNLRYVIPPGYTATTVTDNNADFNELVYAYKYDGRRRLVEKKVPGKGWEWLVYNNNDQLVMTQDAVQRSKNPTNEWSYSKYDAFGRVVVTGTYAKNYASQKLAQDDVNLNTKYWEERFGNANYSTASFPAGSPAVLITNYYDDYSFTGNGTASLGFIGTTKSSKTKGLLTGISVSKDDGTLPLLTINYYDEYGRVIQSSSENHIKGTDVVTNTYSFVGELKTSTRIHKDKAGTVTTTVTTNDYDHVGRLLATKHQIGDVSKAVTLVKNEYNEIGQLKKKNVGGDKDGGNFHTGVSYAYNERGWTSNASSQEFSYALKYNDASAGKQYNGNIAEQHWAHGSPTLSNVFKYSYDALKRLKNGSSTGTVMSELLSYDDMGNIRTLARDGATITYAYNNANKSNRLLSVTGGGLSGNYTYDVNGNAKKDRTGMNFNYNHLNLPDSTWNDAKTVKVGYLYDAMGTKLRKYSTQGGNRDYVDGIEYNGAAIELIHTGEGVAYRNSNGTYTYRYNLTDHLGNVRSTVYRNPSNNNAVEVLQKDDYYPFGKQKVAAGGNNKYLYNGKEIQGELVGQYDYGARFYDAEIGRWNVVDPMSEIYSSYSPYAYVGNDPIFFHDPNGMYRVDANGNITIDDPNEISNFLNYTNNNREASINDMSNHIISAGNGFSWELDAITVTGRSSFESGGWLSAAQGRVSNAVELMGNIRSVSTINMSGHSLADNVGLAGTIGDPIGGGAKGILDNRGVYMRRGQIYGMNKEITVRTPIANINTTSRVLNYARVGGKALGVVGIAATGYQVYGDIDGGRYYSAGTRAAVFGVAAGAAFIPVVGWGVSAGIGVADYIWGDQFYNYVENRMR